VNAKQQSDTKKVAELIERGTPAISVRYADGSQHESFRESSSFVALAGDRVISQRADRTARLGDVSRPEAIGAVEVVHLDANGTPKNAAPSNTASVAKPTQQAPAQAVATVAPAASTGTVQAVPAPAPASGFTMFSGFGSLFGDKKEQAPVSAPQQSATNAVPEKSVLQRWFGGSETSAPAGATSFPATVPLPPRRAGQDNAERVSDAAAARKLMPGAQAIVTADLTAAQ
jgi:hypothetical protein